MKLTAIVILNWNGKKLLKRILDSLLKRTPIDKVDIIVSDNGSTDSSLEFLQIYYPIVKIYSLDKNYGFAEGYNRTLLNLEYEYVVLLNSDVEVGENWFCTAIHYLKTHQEISALQPKILSFSDRSFFEYAGASGGFLDKYGYPFCRGRILETIEKDIGQYNNPLQIFWASGACLFIRLKDFKEVGGFDPAFFAYQEEIDLCWRLNMNGKKIVCFPISYVYHMGGKTTLYKEHYRKTYLNFRNNLLMLYKNSTKSSYKKVRNIRVFLDYLAVLHYIFRGRLKNAFAIILARIDFRKMKKKYCFLERENDIFPSCFFYKSIIWYYYFKNKKKWSDFCNK